MAYKSFKLLQRQVNGILSQSLSNENYLKVIKLCRKFQLSNQNSTSYNQNSINEIVQFKKPDIETYLFEKLELQKRSGDVIRSYLVETPVPDSRFILDAMKQNSDMELNKTALRQLLYKNRDIETSISLIRSNRLLFERNSIITFQKAALSYFICSLSLHGFLEIVLMGQESMNILIDVYLLNMLLYLTLLKNPKNGPVLWRPGTPLLQRFFNRYEYRMYEKLMIAYKELYTTNVSNYHLGGSKLLNSFQNGLPEEQLKLEKLISVELREMGLMMHDDKDEAMFKEYWTTGGEGFEWSEPDRDPIEFLDVTRGISKSSEKM